jgi:hypothetical protein
MGAAHYGVRLLHNFSDAILDYAEQVGGADLSIHQSFYSVSLCYIYRALYWPHIGQAHHHNWPWILEKIWLEEDYISLTHVISLQMGEAFCL